MNESSKAPPGGGPGHYGAGYGEKDAADRAGSPSTAEASPMAATDLDPLATPGEADGAPDATGTAAEPVVFTPDDVTARPPDRTPTENAPESEKAGLIFERS